MQRRFIFSKNSYKLQFEKGCTELNLWSYMEKCQWSISHWTSLQRRILLCFIQLSHIEQYILYAVWQILESKLQFHLRSQFSITELLLVEAELLRIPHGCNFLSYCVRVIPVRQSPAGIRQKIWTTSGPLFWFSFQSISICIFQQRQDLSKECDCSLC